MRFSSTASLPMAGLLAAGGGFCLVKSEKSDHRYLPMAFMSVAVAIQQFAEGLTWTGLETGDIELRTHATLLYMFFVWVFWPVWTAFMTYALEPDYARLRILAGFMAAGFLAGLVLYLPYIIYPGWLSIENVKHSLDYNTVLLPDSILQREVTYLIYLFLVGAPPLFSSYRHIRLFGWFLIFFVPVTYFFFAYADISVLCFFAAGTTVYLVFVIMEDKCGLGSATPSRIFRFKPQRTQ